MIRKMMILLLTLALCLSNGFALAEAPQYDYTLTITVDNFMPEVPPADSGSMKFLEEMTQTDIDCNWVPSSEYMTKINAMIAGDTLTDVVVVTDIKNPNIINACRAGVFWELTEYIQKGDFPRLQKMNDVVRNNLKIDGKEYSLARNLELPFHGITFRSDWLANLGLEKPATMAELTEVIRAFSEDDPDGNGKNDTYGLGMSALNTITTEEQLQVIFGGPNTWEVTEDGKFIPYFEHEAFMKSMNWLRDLYAKGYINPEFSTLTDQQLKELIEASKVGMSIAHIAQITERVPVLQGIDPSYDMDYCVIDEGYGVRMHPSDGVSGMYMIPKSSVPTEEELMRILTFFDRLACVEVQTFMQWGLIGVHSDYNENGKLVMIDESGYNSEVNILRRLKPFTVAEAERGDETPAMNKRQTFYATYEENCIGNPAMAFISETNMKVGTELEQLMNDAKTQYIMGYIDEAGMQEYIQQWYSEGGEKIIAEYEAAYAAAQ